MGVFSAVPRPLPQMPAPAAHSPRALLTHNSEFLFIESLLLTAAGKGGNPSLTVFADAQCAEGSYARERPRTEGEARHS